MEGSRRRDNERDPVIATQTLTSGKRNDLEDPGIVEVYCSGTLGADQREHYPARFSILSLQFPLDAPENQFLYRPAFVSTSPL